MDVIGLFNGHIELFILFPLGLRDSRGSIEGVELFELKIQMMIYDSFPLTCCHFPVLVNSISLLHS